MRLGAVLVALVLEVFGLPRTSNDWKWVKLSTLVIDASGNLEMSFIWRNLLKFGQIDSLFDKFEEKKFSNLVFSKYHFSISWQRLTLIQKLKLHQIWRGPSPLYCPQNERKGFLIEFYGGPYGLSRILDFWWNFNTLTKNRITGYRRTLFKNCSAHFIETLFRESHAKFHLEKLTSLFWIFAGVNRLNLRNRCICGPP